MRCQGRALPVLLLPHGEGAASELLGEPAGKEPPAPGHPAALPQPPLPGAPVPGMPSAAWLLSRHVPGIPLGWRRKLTAVQI